MEELEISGYSVESKTILLENTEKFVINIHVIQKDIEAKPRKRQTKQNHDTGAIRMCRRPCGGKLAVSVPFPLPNDEIKKGPRIIGREEEHQSNRNSAGMRPDHRWYAGGSYFIGLWSVEEEKSRTSVCLKSSLLMGRIRPTKDWRNGQKSEREVNAIIKRRRWTGHVWGRYITHCMELVKPAGKGSSIVRHTDRITQRIHRGCSPSWSDSRRELGLDITLAETQAAPMILVNRWPWKRRYPLTWGLRFSKILQGMEAVINGVGASRRLLGKSMEAVADHSGRCPLGSQTWCETLKLWRPILNGWKSWKICQIRLQA